MISLPYSSIDPISLVGTIDDDMTKTPDRPLCERVRTYNSAAFPNYLAPDTNGYPGRVAYRNQSNNFVRQLLPQRVVLVELETVADSIEHLRPVAPRFVIDVFNISESVISSANAPTSSMPG